MPNIVLRPNIKLSKPPEGKTLCGVFDLSQKGGSEEEQWYSIEN